MSGFTVSKLATVSGVSPRTIRYWERIGLLPAAARTHTGYRVFGSDATRHVRFIRKSKSVGLTLTEIKKLLDLARRGKNPCPELVKWLDAKSNVVDQQIRAVRQLRLRIRQLQKLVEVSLSNCARPDELCCLIEDLAEAKLRKGGDCSAQAMLSGPAAIRSPRR